jgi:hypothetical protein
MLDVFEFAFGNSIGNNILKNVRKTRPSHIINFIIQSHEAKGQEVKELYRWLKV